MPKFSTEVKHELGQDEATERLKSFLDHVRERYKDQVSKLEGDWAGSTLTFSLTTYGFGIEGVLDVDETSARLNGKLPFAAVAFRGKIESSIANALAQALSG